MNTKNMVRVVITCLFFFGLLNFGHATMYSDYDTYDDYRNPSDYNSVNTYNNRNYRYINTDLRVNKRYNTNNRYHNNNRYQELPYISGKSRNYIPNTICFNKKIYNSGYYNNNYKTIVVCYKRSYNTVPTRNTYNSNYY